jgi:aryl-alcohol dehydrogenase-like predicted oxidoreductase
MPGFNELQSKPPAPPTALGRLRLLSPHAAIRCSPILFGGISLGLFLFLEDKIELMIGTAWHEYQPPTDKEKSFKLLDAYVAAGGNFFDTANAYSVSISSHQ